MTSRAALIQDLDDWLARDDLSAGGKEDTFLRIAQAKISRDIRIRDSETTVQLSITGRSIALPSDYVSRRSVTVNSSVDRKIRYLSPQRIREAPVWLNQASSSLEGGVSDMAYTVEGSNLVIAPAASVETPVILDFVYLATATPLVNPTDTNYLLTKHYDVYLWAILSAAAVFLMNDVQQAVYENLYDKVVMDLAISENLSRLSGNDLTPTGHPRDIV